MPKKEAVVVHSGGMDSTICLKLAIEEFGADKVLSLTFDYGQRHQHEIERSQKICGKWGVDHIVIAISCLSQITDDALLNHSLKINHKNGEPPNTLVVGRNGLMARIAAYHPHFHILAADGLFSTDGEDLLYHEIALTPDDIADTEDCIRMRVLRYFGRKGWFDKNAIKRMNSNENNGFSLNANVRIKSWDREGLERLIRYCARPCFKSENLRWNGPWVHNRLPRNIGESCKGFTRLGKADRKNLRGQPPPLQLRQRDENHRLCHKFR